MKRKETITKIEGEVTPVGTGTHVFVPKSWIGKKVKVTLME